MNLNELRKEPHWSYSAFHCYLTCPLKFKFQYIEHVEPEHTCSCFPFGRAFHAALSQRARSGPQLKIADAKELFEAYFKAEINAVEHLVYKPKEDYRSLLQTGFTMLAVCLENWQDDFAVRSVAEGFSVEIPGLSKPLIGEYDLIVEDGGHEYIVDWKTAGAKWSPGKAHQDLQATAFCYARTKLTGRSPLFRFDIVTKTRTPCVESHYTERNEADFLRFERLAQTIESAVQREVFYPNETGFSCADCPYKTKCRSWHVRKG